MSAMERSAEQECGVYVALRTTCPDEACGRITTTGGTRASDNPLIKCAGCGREYLKSESPLAQSIPSPIAF